MTYTQDLENKRLAQLDDLKTRRERSLNRGADSAPPAMDRFVGKL